jgi:glycosyltransferase involved in cell wall biosynthesis
MAKPEVSVIVPTCNRRAMVQEAIAGVLAQQQVSLQLIVVDDGSTDGTWDALVETAKRLPPGSVMDLLRHQSRRGVAAARNAGVELARAPFIAFLDSDDLWQPLKLRHQLDYMRAHPGCLIMQCDEIWIRDGRQVNPGRRHRKRAGDFFAEA